jgi:hypothetical protein
VRLLAVLAAVAAVAGASPLGAQTAQVVAAIEPDTVLVGQPFVLGVTVQLDPGAEVRFPSTLPILEDVEQLGAADVRSEDQDDGIFRAYYRILAWKAVPTRLPEFSVDYFGPDGSGIATVTPPTVQVVSVLPAETENLELRPARPFIEGGRFPWWWIALALFVAWLAWRSLRRAEEPAPVIAAVRLTPAEAALVSIRELQIAWEAGRVGEVDYFDRLESILRAFMEAVHALPSGTVIRAAVNGHRSLAVALRRSALVRFGRLEAPDMEILTATRVFSDWIRAEGKATVDGSASVGAAVDGAASVVATERAETADVPDAGAAASAADGSPAAGTADGREEDEPR